MLLASESLVQIEGVPSLQSSAACGTMGASSSRSFAVGVGLGAIGALVCVKAVGAGFGGVAVPGRASCPTRRVLPVVLTGGPCAGKTSMLAPLRERFASLGIQVFTVPEPATTVFSGGCQWLPGDAYQVAFVSALLAGTIAVEDMFVRIAEASDKPTVVLMDRATLDNRPFLSDKCFEEALRRVGWTEQDLLSRYACVLHLVTTANGAADFYSWQGSASSTNKYRMETPNEACERDVSLMAAYQGHPHRVVIPNRRAPGASGFQIKTDEVFDEMFALCKAHGFIK